MVRQETESLPLERVSCSERLVELFSFLGNRIRFRIICLLFVKERCVSELVDLIEDAKEPNVSQQLKILAGSGILHRKRAGRHVFYSLKDPEVKEFIRFLKEYYNGGRER